MKSHGELHIVTQAQDPAFRFSRRRAIAAFGVTAAAVAMPGLALAAPNNGDATSTVSGYVFVNLNTTTTNTVAGYARNSDGTLTALPGSPFSVGGAGSGTGLGSQGSIQLAHGGRHLLVADAGTNQISVLRVKLDGSLQAVAGSPFASGGVSPVTIAVGRGLVFVGNQGTGGSNYTGFVLGPSGTLTPIPGSTVTVPDGSGIGEVVFDATGRHLVGARVNTSLIDSFVV
jgi:6-phosphogluconolactonase